MQNVKLLILFSAVSCLCVRCPPLAPTGLSTWCAPGSAGQRVCSSSVVLAAVASPTLCYPEQSCVCSRIPASLVLQSPEKIWYCWAPSQQWMPQDLYSPPLDSCFKCFPPPLKCTVICSPSPKMCGCLSAEVQAGML